MITRAKAHALRALIEKASVSLSDEDALGGIELFHHWDETEDYTTGDRVYHDGKLYKCLQDHSAQSEWNPADAVSLWAEVLIPDPSVIPEWVQPDSTNPYMAGDKVRHLGKVWVSDIDYNVYEPSVYGWTEEVSS